jgi:anaerobic selenocysteine-containing dehydrogenase
VQWGGPLLCEGWSFPTADGKAHFAAVAPPERELPPGRFFLSTRRGKQFNSMVVKDRDPLTGFSRRDLLMAAEDAAAAGVAEGEEAVLRSDHGEMRVRVRIAALRPGNVQAFWPEANVLLPRGITDPASGIPDYTTTVEVLTAAPHPRDPGF